MTRTNCWIEFAYRVGPPLIWALIISGLSTDTFSADHTGGFVLPMLHWILPGASAVTLDLFHTIIRKTMHAVEYGVLALLCYRGVRQPDGPQEVRYGLIALALSVAIAALDEFHQSFIPSRGASVADLALDSMGAAVGLAVWAGGKNLKAAVGRKAAGSSQRAETARAQAEVGSRQ